MLFQIDQVATKHDAHTTPVRVDVSAYVFACFQKMTGSDAIVATGNTGIASAIKLSFLANCQDYKKQVAQKRKYLVLHTSHANAVVLSYSDNHIKRVQNILHAQCVAWMNGFINGYMMVSQCSNSSAVREWLKFIGIEEDDYPFETALMQWNRVKIS